MSQPTIQQARELFDWLAQGDCDQFASGCAEDLVLAARGSEPATTYISKSEIADWYLSLESLVGATLYTESEVIRVEGIKTVILLRHEFEREEVTHTFAMVNVCTFREHLLATWSTYPLNLPDYASALGIQHSLVPQLA